MSIGNGNHGVAKWMEFFLYEKSANAARLDKKLDSSFENQICERDADYIYTEIDISTQYTINIEGEKL